jgi:hypothetical protein
MKIHAQPCATGPEAWTHQYDLLRQFFESSSPRLHEWTENADEADIIFLTNTLQRTGSAVEKHPLPRRYPEKCFILSEQWEPPFLLAGIYANAPRSALGRGRFRTGSYALYHPDFRNPFVEDCDYAADLADRRPDLLASFIGRDCHPVRKRLFALNFPADKILLEDSSTFDAFTHALENKRERQRHYFDVCRRSKFILCPRGAGPNSIRLFEALKLGLAPVIISDAWMPCEGPRWAEFALFLAEKDVARIPEILAQAEPTYRERGVRARQAYEDFFAPQSYFNYLVAAAASALSQRIIPERWFVALWPVQRLLRQAKLRGRRLVGAH